MEYLDQLSVNGQILQVYWDPSSSSLVLVDGNSGATVGAQRYPSREGAIAALQAIYQNNLPAEPGPSGSERLGNWFRKQRLKNYANIGEDLAIEKARNKLSTERASGQKVGAERVEKVAKALGTIARGGTTEADLKKQKQRLEVYDSPALRDMSLRMDWTQGGRGQSLAALKNVTNLPSSDMRSATLPAASKNTNRPSGSNLDELRGITRPAGAARSVNNPYTNIKRRTPDLTQLQVSTTPRLRRVQGATLPSASRSLPVGQYVKPPSSIVSKSDIVSVPIRTSQSSSPLSKVAREFFEVGLKPLINTRSSIAQVARQKAVLRNPIPVNNTSPQYTPQVLSVKSNKLAIKRPNYYGRTIKKLGQGVR